MLATLEKSTVTQKAKQSPLCNFCKCTAEPEISLLRETSGRAGTAGKLLLAVALERHGGTPAAIRRFVEMEVKP